VEFTRIGQVSMFLPYAMYKNMCRPKWLSSGARVCLRNMFSFFLDILNESFMLCYCMPFVSNHVLSLCLPDMLLTFLLVLYLLCLVLCVSRVFSFVLHKDGKDTEQYSSL
jgi:hypothetical protein